MAIATKKTMGGGRGSVKTTSSATVTLKQIAAQLVERQDLSKKQTEAVLTDLVVLTARHLKKGARLRLTGLAATPGSNRCREAAAPTDRPRPRSES